MRLVRVYDIEGNPCVAFQDDPPNPLVEAAMELVKIIEYLCIAWFLLLLGCLILAVVGSFM